VVPQNLYFIRLLVRLLMSQEGQRSQEGSLNEGRAIEAKGSRRPDLNCITSQLLGEDTGMGMGSLLLLVRSPLLLVGFPIEMETLCEGVHMGWRGRGIGTNKRCRMLLRVRMIWMFVGWGAG
jgi:hypothetical protein